MLIANFFLNIGSSSFIHSADVIYLFYSLSSGHFFFSIFFFLLPGHNCQEQNSNKTLFVLGVRDGRHLLLSICLEITDKLVLLGAKFEVYFILVSNVTVQFSTLKSASVSNDDVSCGGSPGLCPYQGLRETGSVCPPGREGDTEDSGTTLPVCAWP